jgi:hypothetical protein
MAFQKITLAPGVNTQRTATLNKGGWSDSDLIRFREGLPEVKGGWAAFLSGGPAQGAVRALHAWSTLDAIATLGIGTNQRLYISQGFAKADVTPIVKTTGGTLPPYTTTLNSSIVEVHDHGNPQSVGNIVEISGSSAVAGVTVAGEFTVLSVIDGDHYTISVAPQVANAAADGGGTPTFNYLLPVGLLNATQGSGWGSGGWGNGTWGTPRIGASAGVVFPRLWTIDNWGENMLANPRGAAGIFQWVAATGTTVRAVALSGAPTTANGVVVAAPVQIAVAFGCNPPAGGVQDPMLVAWSDEGDNTSWTPTPANQAGSFRLNNGSQIMQAVPSQQQILIWTDTALYGMQYIQPPLVWGFTQLGASCGAISPQAAGVLGGRALWMSGFEFWTYSGEPTVIDCPLRDRVFKNLNRLQQSKIVCAINTEWSEVTWYYPSLNAQENDSYITLNVDELARSGPLNAWYGGTLARTAWIDDNIFGSPVSGDGLGNVWSEEQDYTANGAAMPWFIKSGYIDISAGEDYSFLDLIIPDQILTGQVGYTIFALVDPSDVPQQFGPFIVTPSTRFLPNGTQGLRVRARAIALQVDNSPMVVGSFWRHGAPRFRISPDGRN